MIPLRVVVALSSLFHLSISTTTHIFKTKEEKGNVITHAFILSLSLLPICYLSVFLYPFYLENARHLSLRVIRMTVILKVFLPKRVSLTSPPRSYTILLDAEFQVDNCFPLVLEKCTTPLAAGLHDFWWELWCHLLLCFCFVLFFFCLLQFSVKLIHWVCYVLSSKIVFDFPLHLFACWGFLFICLGHT